ncbi:YciI family protein [Siphonobacter aquaeclarae]|jgi:uncharacterized protein YciI|uniref:Uncharacterized conserved protein YciI, contains a putative active-site phosphohistidine n=1 Tax=Siphonobacter aquaeclarae TaxID=563176 RepID=A0A1G9XTK4_9BACT|nr:YciI family protein [Siphonobacter aquaeclarae]MBO9637527.1 hypothetical protein [Siphonobacter aquaeclarae]SDM99505.1 Uncharacterized conserved protein YciI, contains a putative active-site phosphohistidine [Siphonobacter aquaeclarae]
MKKVLLLLLLCATGASAQTTYDEPLARKLGADEYGMKKYVLAFLKTGSVKIEDKNERMKVQKEHLRNMNRLAEEGKLIVAGPFLDGKENKGILIFNVESMEEAQKLAESDPGVKAGIFALELHPWYGSAALIETPRLHKTLQKKNVAD